MTGEPRRALCALGPDRRSRVCAFLFLFFVSFFCSISRCYFCSASDPRTDALPIPPPFFHCCHRYLVTNIPAGPGAGSGGCIGGSTEDAGALLTDLVELLLNGH
jgi:hypothetical protein